MLPKAKSCRSCSCCSETTVARGRHRAGGVTRLRAASASGGAAGRLRGGRASEPFVRHGGGGGGGVRGGEAEERPRKRPVRACRGDGAVSRVAAASPGRWPRPGVAVAPARRLAVDDLREGASRGRRAAPLWEDDSPAATQQSAAAAGASAPKLAQVAAVDGGEEDRRGGEEDRRGAAAAAVASCAAARARRGRKWQWKHWE